MLKNIVSFLYSSYCFFFRVPIPFEYKFTNSGILIGGLIQSLAYFILYYCLQLFLIESVATILALISLSLLTGFFHEDGLADTADSLGVPLFNDTSSKKKCLEALKDSRLGAYGVNSISILWIFRCLFILSCQHPGWCGFLSVGLSRLFVLSIGHILIRNEFLNSINSMSQTHQLAGIPIWKNFSLSLFQLGFYVILGNYWFNFSSLFLMCLFFLNVFIVFSLCISLSRRTNGVNGDYLGATICILEVFHLLMFSYANPSQNFNIWGGK